MTADVSTLFSEEPGGDGLPSWAKTWDLQEMKSYLETGICEEVTSEERIGVQPYWLREIEVGAMEELRRELGKLSKLHEGYLLGFKRPVLLPGLGKQDSHPRPLIYFKFQLTRYVYKPAEGQQLKGIITRLGQNAASCVVFGTFMATVYPKDETEFQSWQLEDELQFTVVSFDALRKGVSLRGKSTGVITSRSAKKLNRKRKFSDTEVADEQTVEAEAIIHENADEAASEALDESSKKKKKKKRKRNEDSVIQDTDQVDVLNNVEADESQLSVQEPVKKKRKKDK